MSVNRSVSGNLAEYCRLCREEDDRRRKGLQTKRTPLSYSIMQKMLLERIRCASKSKDLQLWCRENEEDLANQITILRIKEGILR